MSKRNLEKRKHNQKVKEAAQQEVVAQLVAQKQTSPTKLLLFTGVSCFVAGVLLMLFLAKVDLKPEIKSSIQPAKNLQVETREPLSVKNITSLSPSEIAKIDIAEMNLLCAKGLPGAENLKLPESLMILDQLADHIYSETQRNIYKFHDSPGDFNNSEAYFRILILVTVLEQDFGIHYNPMLISYPSAQKRELITDFAKNSQDIFIHGLLGRHRAGTCSSLPVLTVAVGRRLGYPLKLSHSTEHLFTRWDDGKERFNIDSNGKGLICHPDSFYKNWPHKITESDIQKFGYLESMTPAQELEVFLRMRSLCLVEAGKLIEAEETIIQARTLFPKSKVLHSLLIAVFDKEMANIYGKKETFLKHEARSAQTHRVVAQPIIDGAMEAQMLNRINKVGRYRQRGLLDPAPDLPGNPGNSMYTPQWNINKR